MATQKHFLQDRTILLFVSIESFIVLLSVVLITLRLSTSQGKATFVTQFRSQPNAVDFVTGGVGVNGTTWDIVSFVIAALLMYGFGIVLVYRTYAISRQLAIVTLVLTLVLLMFMLVVSNILLGLR